MTDFRDYDDVIWASASATLGLTLFDAAGEAVRARDGTREHVMRGRLGGLAAVVEMPHLRGTHRCIVRVELAAPLMLGLRWRYGAELSDIAPPVYPTFVAEGIDEERVRRFAMRTRASAAIEEAIRGLGLVFAIMDDTSVRISRFGAPDGPSFFIDVARVAERVAHGLADARREIGDAGWEPSVRADLEDVAASFGADADVEGYVVRGSLGGTSIDLAVRTSGRRFEIVASIVGRRSSELVIETRASRRGHLLHDLFHRHATGDDAFDRVFAVDADGETVRRRCTAEVRAALLGLGADTLRYEAGGLTATLPLSPMLIAEGGPRGRIVEWVERLRSAVLALGGGTSATPYR